MEDIVPEHIRSLVPYPPGKPLSELERELGVSKAIKLASNENALGPSPKAMEAIAAALPELHRYPDGGGFYLKRRLAAHVGVTPEQLLLGNGSNEIIELLIRTFCTPTAGVLTSECTFVVYRLISTAAGVPFTAVPMQDHTFDTDAIAERVGPDTRMVFLCNPNNPTGTMFGQSSLDRFAAKVGDDVIIVLDEAYWEYVPEQAKVDALGLLADRPRTVILRTFSKAYGLAGVRVGYGITSPDLAEYVNRVRQPFNVNTLGQVACQAALDDTEHVERVLSMTREGLDHISAELKALGMTPVPTATNFVLFDTHQEAWPLYEALLRQGVIVRPMKAYGLPNYLRVNAGTPEENERFLSTFREIL
ncbi:MAG: histidinol-phosphate aminotransferase [Myxococcota bacterium]|jgi:histidinol-phosphate aminotransferase